MHKPRLLIADEPTSALDAITQSEILDLFRSLNRELNMAMLFVSHDLLAVASLCSRIAILQRGQIVESGPTEQMFRDPRTDDTRALLQAVLRNSSAAAEFATANCQRARDAARIRRASLRSPLNFTGRATFTAGFFKQLRQHVLGGPADRSGSPRSPPSRPPCGPAKTSRC